MYNYRIRFFPYLAVRTRFEAMTGRTNFIDGLLAEILPGFPVAESYMSRDLCPAPGIISLPLLSLADRRDTSDKEPLIKADGTATLPYSIFLPQSMAPWTTGLRYIFSFSLLSLNHLHMPTPDCNYY